MVMNWLDLAVEKWSHLPPAIFIFLGDNRLVGLWIFMNNFFTQLPNYLWDRDDLTVYDRVILIHIVRKTIGWGKVSDGISLNQFCNDLSISKNTVIKSINSLSNKEIVTQSKRILGNGAQGFSYYQISKNIIDKVNSDVPEPSNNEGSRDEQGVVHEMNRGGSRDEQTKETNTKETNTKEKKIKDLSSSPVNLIFDFWRDTLKHPRSRLDETRKKAITKALKNGFSVEDIKQAIIGCSKTPHNMGSNDSHQKYDDIELIVRNAKNIERFMNNAENNNPQKFTTNELAIGGHKQQSHFTPKTQRNIEVGLAWLEEG